MVQIILLDRIWSEVHEAVANDAAPFERINKDTPIGVPAKSLPVRRILDKAFDLAKGEIRSGLDIPFGVVGVSRFSQLYLAKCGVETSP